MTILWIYNQPLIPEAGGTERITSLVAKGLTELGHKCLGILEFREYSEEMIYCGEKVPDLNRFLSDNKVDVVINQIAYATWLLDYFLQRGGYRWHEQGGKIISCLHFDPKNPSNLYLVKSAPSSFGKIIKVIKAFLLAPYYNSRQQKNEGDTYNYIYDNSDVFVALSTSHFHYLKKVMSRKNYEKLTAINNPLTFDDISRSEELSKKKKVVLVCSRMSEYHKRISLILKVWQRISKHPESEEWTLKILGDGPDLPSYRKFVEKNKLKNVEFFGIQSPEPFYREASILMLTSSAEGWGLNLTEALQRGVVPVVMNSCPVFQEIITHCYNGYLSPEGNITRFKEYLFALMTDSISLHAMQQNALISATKFALSKTMTKWQEII